LTKVNLGTKENVQQVKVNPTLEPIVIDRPIKLLKEFKNVFAWTYKDLKGIPLETVQHHIEFGYHSTTYSSSKVLVESQLCYYGQVRYRQVTCCWFYQTS
jgi:hypothetical protein